MANVEGNAREPSLEDAQRLRTALAHREGFDEVFNRISNALIALPLDQLESWIADTLREIGTYLAVDRVYVFLFDDTGEAIGAVFEWCAEGVQYHPHEQLIGVTVDNFPWSMSHWTRGENVYVGHPDDLPEEAAPERGACEAFTIKSYINVPLFAAGKLHGWVGLDSVEEHHRTWPGVDVTMTRWVGESVINTMFRRSRERLLLDKQQRLEREIFQRRQAEADLVRAKAKVQEANRLKSALLANLSHELQTPLNGIVGYADLLALEIADSSQQELVDGLVESALRLSNTASSMLSLSELESQLLRIELQDTSIKDCLAQVAEEMAFLAEDKGLTFELSGPDETRAALDLGLAAASISNVVDNAIKYTDTGHVRVQWGRDGEERVFVRVEDTGVGIAEEQMKYIFDEFRQGSEGDEREYEGVGLGLALAKKMVTLMRGSIDATSAPGQGSVFTVKFMTPQAHAAAQSALQADLSKAE